MGIVGSKEIERVENPRSSAPEESPMEVEKAAGKVKSNMMPDDLNDPLGEAFVADDGPSVVVPITSGDERINGNYLGCSGVEVRTRLMAGILRI
ncbi:hypothetical protein Hanom_Chr11g00975851 [Helianthus anomalus]